MPNNLDRIQTALKNSDVDAVLLNSIPDRQFATGFHSTAGYAFITPDSAAFLIDFRYIDAARKEIEGFDIVMATSELKYETIINDIIAKKGIKRVGFKQDGITYAQFTALEKLINAELVPSGDMINGLRASKQAWEIEYMQRAQDISEEVLDEVLGLLRPGISEVEVSAEIVYRIIKKGADGISFDPIVVSGPNSALPHGVPGSRRIEHGDFVTLDFGSRYRGYCSDMTRTVAIGSATDEMKKIYEIVHRAQQTGIDAMRAGVVGSEVDAASRAVISAEGYGEYFGHGFGHSVGLEVHESPNANTIETKTLPKGAVVTAEPGIYLPGKFGVRIEDMLEITENGSRNLTKAAKALLIL